MKMNNNKIPPVLDFTDAMYVDTYPVYYLDDYDDCRAYFILSKDDILYTKDVEFIKSLDLFDDDSDIVPTQEEVDLMNDGMGYRYYEADIGNIFKRKHFNVDIEKQKKYQIKFNIDEYNVIDYSCYESFMSDFRQFYLLKHKKRKKYVVIEITNESNKLPAIWFIKNKESFNDISEDPDDGGFNY